MNADFTPTGHPKGSGLTETQKMLYLRLENMYLEMSREIGEYLAYNDNMVKAIERLHESRQFALKSVCGPELTRASTTQPSKKNEPLRADGYGAPKKAEVKNEEKSETQKACQEVNSAPSKALGKKRGRPAGSKKAQPEKHQE